MNMIVCNQACCYQEDGYCCLEGQAAITNAAAEPCCYFKERGVKGGDGNDKDRGDNKAL